MTSFNPETDRSPDILLNSDGSVKAFAPEGLAALLQFIESDYPRSVVVSIEQNYVSLSRSVAALAYVVMKEPWKYYRVQECRTLAQGLPGIAFAETSANNFMARLLDVFRPLDDKGWGIRNERSYGYYFGRQIADFPKIPSFQTQYSGMSADNFSPIRGVDGNILTMTRTYYRILSILTRNSETMIEREQMLSELYDDDSSVETGIVDVTISRLRQMPNLFDYTVPSWRIRTVWNFGYIFKFCTDTTDFEEKILEKNQKVLSRK